MEGERSVSGRVKQGVGGVGKRHLSIGNSLFDRGTRKLKLGNTAIDWKCQHVLEEEIGNLEGDEEECLKRTLTAHACRLYTQQQNP
ncbi:unnamed protein product [Sphenostylis stenocarpa]|uniref:Uncharacterized protein n=1 Tax=Sphenostylis stenocarpa TaxID=92480 RepID=A0AA86V811_9FABA|nr:unnamed protein product [Sphenostylis stenocarpa]